MPTFRRIPWEDIRPIVFDKSLTFRGRPALNQLTRTGLFFGWILFSSLWGVAQEKGKADYYGEGPLRYADHVYDDRVATVRLHPAGQPLEPPVISRGKGRSLVLSFDLFDENAGDIRYTLVHCNASWDPSELSEMRYKEGFMEADIRDHEFSFNTEMPYIHFEQRIPGKDIRLTKSGNYLLKVYKAGNEEDLLLTRRLMVVKEKVGIQPKVKQPRIVKYMDTHHEIEFTINLKEFSPVNPRTNLEAVLLKNQRWDVAKTGLKPKYMRSGELVYELPRKAVFYAGNEYRTLDIRNLKRRSQRVREIRYDRSRGYDVFLLKEEPRRETQLHSFRDMNGGFRIESRLGREHALESDYVYVHFYLSREAPYPNGQVYVFGGLCDRRLREGCRMTFDSKKGAYTNTLLLKQGIYDYQYVHVDDRGPLKGGLAKIEGSRFDTENDYTILLYYGAPSDQYDQLIGYRHFNWDP